MGCGRCEERRERRARDGNSEKGKRKRTEQGERGAVRETEEETQGRGIEEWRGRR